MAAHARNVTDVDFIVESDAVRVKCREARTTAVRQLGRTQPGAITLVVSINCTTPATRWQQLMQSCLW